MMRYVLLFGLLLCSIMCPAQQPAVIVNGKLDLRKWNMVEEPVILLEGKWSFFWNELLTTSEVKSRSSNTYAEFSHPWTEQVIDEQTLPGKGFATYALEILLPSNHDSLAIVLPAMFNSSALWINDGLICENGKVGRSEESMIPQWRNQTVSIPGGDTLLVVVQIANFQTTRGGSAVCLHFGSAEELLDRDHVSSVSINLLIGFFIVVAVVALLLFAFSERSALLYFSALSLAFALRFLFTDLYPYLDFNISLPWEVAAKLEYVSIPLITICSVLFVASLYPQELKKWARNFFLLINGVLIIITLIVGADKLSRLLVYSQLIASIFLLYLTYVILMALIYKRIGARASVAGLLIFILTGMYNLYTYLYVIELNRIIILTGYTLALILNGVSLWYRTTERLREEQNDTLRYSDLYGPEK